MVVKAAAGVAVEAVKARIKYVPAVIARMAAPYKYTYRTPGDLPNLQVQLVPGEENEIDAEELEQFLGNSAFLRDVLKRGIQGEGLEELAIAKVKGWAKEKLVDIALVELAERLEAKREKEALAAAAPEPVVEASTDSTSTDPVSKDVEKTETAPTGKPAGRPAGKPKAKTEAKTEAKQSDA